MLRRLLTIGRCRLVQRSPPGAAAGPGARGGCPRHPRAERQDTYASGPHSADGGTQAAARVATRAAQAGKHATTPVPAVSWRASSAIEPCFLAVASDDGACVPPQDLQRITEYQEAVRADEERKRVRLRRVLSAGCQHRSVAVQLEMRRKQEETKRMLTQARDEKSTTIDSRKMCAKRPLLLPPPPPPACCLPACAHALSQEILTAPADSLRAQAEDSGGNRLPQVRQCPRAWGPRPRSRPAARPLAHGSAPGGRRPRRSSMHGCGAGSSTSVPSTRTRHRSDRRLIAGSRAVADTSVCAPRSNARAKPSGGRNARCSASGAVMRYSTQAMASRVLGAAGGSAAAEADHPSRGGARAPAAGGARQGPPVPHYQGASARDESCPSLRSHTRRGVRRRTSTSCPLRTASSCSDSARRTAGFRTPFASASAVRRRRSVNAARHVGRRRSRSSQTSTSKSARSG